MVSPWKGHLDLPCVFVPLHPRIVASSPSFSLSLPPPVVDPRTNYRQTTAATSTPSSSQTLPRQPNSSSSTSHGMCLPCPSFGLLPLRLTRQFDIVELLCTEPVLIQKFKRPYKEKSNVCHNVTGLLLFSSIRFPGPWSSLPTSLPLSLPFHPQSTVAASNPPCCSLVLLLLLVYLVNPAALLPPLPPILVIYIHLAPSGYCCRTPLWSRPGLAYYDLRHRCPVAGDHGPRSTDEYL